MLLDGALKSCLWGDSGYLYFHYCSNGNFGLNFMVARKSGKLKKTLNNFVVASTIGT